ncbi:hypothetical protein WN55_00102 [Dufourea novaeangliae]|uniref:RIIa domain-containing protein n=1 Tax=Dufourea novaeangliae TaxID=178035 RepID=A0A154NWJ6_DUFNO|nr:hypothetical protein WN55_00102 [Dufourea novaeangliae]
MDVMLQEHGAKHVYKVPEGLRELCSDISREVLRSQPENLYAFIAEYVDTLLITRENTKVAVKVVNNILLGSQAILCILYRAGFSLEQIAVAAPRIQQAFREYLDAIDVQAVCQGATCDEQSRISIRSILEATGSTRKDAERAATVIQAAFRGHYERIALNEAQGKIQWQRAVTNTLEILKKAGATQVEISKAARHVKFAYRGYYTRRNQRMDAPETEEELKRDQRILEPAEAIQAVAWMEMMYEDSGLTLETANEAATIIQKAFKKYCAKRASYDVHRLESTKTMVVNAVLDSLRYRIFQNVISRENIPTEYGTREELTITSSKVQMTFKERLQMTRISKEDDLESAEEEEEVEYDEEYDEAEEIVTTELSPDSEYRPAGSEAKIDAEYTEEQLTETEMNEQRTSEDEITTEEQLPTGVEPQSKPEVEYPTELEVEEQAEEEEKPKEKTETEVHRHEEEDGEPNVAQETGTADGAEE